MYVIARNAASRPTLVHKSDDMNTTVCGLHIYNWSRRFMNILPSELQVMLCLKCKARG